MKTKIVIYALLMLSFLAKAQNTPEISLLTFETGDKSYTVFGHTAIRVKDTVRKTDYVYDFGNFDFETPHFLAKFCTGKLDYHMGIRTYKATLPSYFAENRQIFEQKLNLNPLETQRLIKQLHLLYQPENRYYRYRFLGKNCSTEIRDIILKDIKGVTYTPTQTQKTYRNYLDNYTRNTPWFKFGINLALGSNIDHEIDSNQLMFLPDFLMKEVSKADLNGKPLAEKAIKTFEHLKPKSNLKWQLTPFLFFAFMLVIIVLGKSKFLIRTYMLATGLGGLLILVVNLFSQHPEVLANYNLLWLNPIYLVAFGLSFTSKIQARKLLSTLLALCLLVTLIIWLLNIQGYDIAFFPILITLSWINLKQRQAQL